MKVIMPLIRKEWVDEIFIVDGGSTDGTVEFARENGYPVYVQKRMGFRHAYIDALDVIKSDYVIAFGPDGNSLADKFPNLKRRPLRAMIW
jgi:glycosyltransferase involved in cell wall biosynthesis